MYPTLARHVGGQRQHPLDAGLHLPGPSGTRAQTARGGATKAGRVPGGLSRPELGRGGTPARRMPGIRDRAAGDLLLAVRRAHYCASECAPAAGLGRLVRDDGEMTAPLPAQNRAAAVAETM